MQVQKINNTTAFQGHGARNFGEVMEKLYKGAYNGSYIPNETDIVQFTTKMKDGKEVTAVADFYGGKFMGITFPYEFVKYKSEFCKKLMETYNNAITKGKTSRRPHH